MSRGVFPQEHVSRGGAHFAGTANVSRYHVIQIISSEAQDIRYKPDFQAPIARNTIPHLDSRATSPRTPAEMACSRCSAHARLLRAAFRPAQTPRFAPITPIIQRRAQSTQGLDKAIEKEVKDAPRAPAGTGISGSYAIYRGTEQLYNIVAAPAAYSISIVDRHNGTVELLPDGEEVGTSEGPWHKRAFFSSLNAYPTLVHRPPRQLSHC